MDKIIIFYVALYIRLSREDGDKEESDSVSNQRKLLIEYIENKQEFVLKDVYVDDGYSGTNFERPEFKRMIQDIEKGEINCVIVKDLSRFGRDYIDTGRYLERFFPEMGIRFISLSDGIDSMKKAYDMMLPIKNIFNEQYARDISQKIQATLKTKQRSGEFIGSFASYGYKKSTVDKNKLVIDEYPASIVKRIFEMYISGVGKQKIARILTKEGILCPSAYKELNGDKYKNSNYKNSTYWTYSTVNSILHKEIYIGNMVQGTKHQTMRSPQVRVDRKDWIVVEQTHEPIIDMDTWNKAQHLLKCRTRELDLTTRQSIFAGMIRCGDCNAAMAKVSWSKADGTKVYSFYCGTYKRYGNQYCTPHTMPLAVLESIVLADLKKIIQSIDDLETLAKAKKAGHKQPDKDTRQSQIMQIQGELDKVRKWKQSVYEDWKEDLITKEEYISYRQDYIKKEELLLKQIELLEASGKESQKDLFESEWVKRLLQLKDIEELDRSTVIEMIDSIYVYENRKIKIVYNFTDELKDLFETNMIFRN